MDSIKAFSKGVEARAAGNKMKVFDWHKAAQFVNENPEALIEAGLGGDMEWTGGVIAHKGDPVTNSYTYLASIWATPIIVIDEEERDCWVWQDDTTWDSETKWPDSALKLLKKK